MDMTYDDILENARKLSPAERQQLIDELHEEADDDDLMRYLLPPARRLTPAEIVAAGLTGGWQDRKEIGDAVEFVERLNRRLWGK